MAHHDQLSIEYYGKGDLLLADAGETKYLPSPDNFYGQYGIHHNGIEIEDPRTPFIESVRTDSQARGVYKGNTNGIDTPATIETVIDTPWMEGIVASDTITTVIEDYWADKKTLTSPIDYSRTILYPEGDYFVIFDRFDGTEEWTYRNVFRPTSLSITPTQTGAIGNVHGDLSVDGTPYNWLSLAYKDETKTGITTSSLKWDTTNPYGEKVNLNIYSVPASEVIVTKHTTRIAGYGKEAEVYAPIVYLKDGPEKDLYRITVLTSKYLNEVQKNVEEIPVSGNGNAIQVSATGNTDTIYSGKGDASFDVFNTDADKVFFRNQDNAADYYCLMSGGSYLEKNGDDLISISKTDSGMEITIHISQNNIFQIKRDGMPYTDFKATETDSAVQIHSDKTDSTFEIYSKGKTAYIILPDEVESSYPSQNSATSGIKTGIIPSEQKAGNLPLNLISGITLFTFICWDIRRE